MIKMGLQNVCNLDTCGRDVILMHLQVHVVGIPIVVAKLVQCLTLPTLQLYTFFDFINVFEQGKSQTVVK